jgi:hypothetical protein
MFIGDDPPTPASTAFSLIPLTAEHMRMARQRD